ncbi:MAG: type II toxin-antitoxin system MqsA family antitoxin [Candidatus Methylomirabilales bacterium]
MRCRICGSELRPVVTDLPFKLSAGTIVIIKDLPVIQCGNCTEYSLADAVMASVERILEKVDEGAELEVVKYAA